MIGSLLLVTHYYSPPTFFAFFPRATLILDARRLFVCLFVFVLFCLRPGLRSCDAAAAAAAVVDGLELHFFVALHRAAVALFCVLLFFGDPVFGVPFSYRWRCIFVSVFCNCAAAAAAASATDVFVMKYDNTHRKKFLCL